MKARVNVIKITTAVLLTGTVLFYWLLYPAHIRFQEQYQLFEFTWNYFVDVVSVPGGFADWCGRFLTQFFIFPWSGAVIIAALMLLVRRLSFRLASVSGVTAFILSWAPAVCLFSFFLSDKNLPSGAVAVLLPMVSSVAVKELPQGTVRSTAILLSVPVLYLLCGPAAILYALLLPKDEPLPVRAAAPLITVLCPVAAQYLCHYPLGRLFSGVHYCRIPSEFPSVLWLTVLSVVAAGISAGKIGVYGRNRRQLPVTALSAAAVAAFGAVLITLIIDMDRERTMQYEFAAMDEDWDAIIDKAGDRPPANTVTLGCLNLALAMTDQLPERQFSYPQAGEKGLFPPYSISYTSLLTVSEIYWHLGMTNACQQYVFDAQEAIPDFQKSGRCCRRLAETFLINGDYEVAEKYLRALGRTLFHRRWAEEVLSLAGEPGRIDDHPVYGEKRRLRDDDSTALFNENNKYTACARILSRNPENRLAGVYLTSLLLLEKDFVGFGKNFRPVEYDVLPKHYQEALILMCVNDRKPLNTLSGQVSEQNIKRMGSFIKDMKSHAPEPVMKKKYGDTYWYYAIFK